MDHLKLNETPVRTSKNFNINNIKLENVNIPEDAGEFKNVKIYSEGENIHYSNHVSTANLVYGISQNFAEMLNQRANQNIGIHIESGYCSTIHIDFTFDKNNLNLLDNIEILADAGAKANVIIKYKTLEDLEYFHNGMIRLFAKENSQVNVIFVNFINTKSNHFVSIQNDFEANSKVKYTIVDFGGKNSVTNYYANLLGDSSENMVRTIYLGKENQLIDLNYIGELRGKKASINIDVQGALKDVAKKHFKGTIDFKKGSKKSKGDENEFCMLLSDTARSLALPMLLCSEEDVEGNHASSAGKVGEKELFYIMSRGFSFKEAMKLVVRARFNNIISEIEDEKLRDEILEEIDIRLD
ncbi:MAG: SufD family Fe-S cluster assembly protein [Clostridia bacterium]|nr:SufD family Fe-S cluster assembly protein [Clostridia bacterium]